MSAKSREDLWSRDATAAYIAGRGRNPICPHCDLPVTPGQAWDECHVGTPKFAGGKRTAVGHRICNRLANNKADTPAFAKGNRVRQRHIGARGPGLGKSPMRAGRRSGTSKSFRHGLVPRLTHAERHAAFLERRYGLAAESDDHVGL